MDMVRVLTAVRHQLARELSRVIDRRYVFSKDNWEAQYANGQWEYLKRLGELSRNSVIAGYCKYLKRNAAILDLGCGEGPLHDAMDSRAYSRYVGVDISQTAIDRIRFKQNENTSFIAQDIDAFTSEERFDFVIFNECLYYLPDPIATMERYEALLKPDGLFIVSMYLHPRAVAWRKIEARYTLIDSTRVFNNAGLSWICKVLATESRTPICA